MAKQLYTCQMWFPTIDDKKAREYKNVSNLARFKRFAASKGAIYFNTYEKPPKGSPNGTRGIYVGRTWIEENFPRNKQ